MAKVVIRKVRIIKPNVLNSLTVLSCLFCLSIVAYGVIMIANRTPYKGECPWESDTLKHDLAEFALLCGITTILNWITVTITVYVIYKFYKEGAYDDDLVGSILFTGIVGFTIPFFATVPFLFVTLFQENFAYECILSHHDGARWLIIAVIPSIIPIILYASIFIFALLSMILEIFNVVYKFCRESYNKGDFCCFYIVEELEVV